MANESKSKFVTSIVKFNDKKNDAPGLAADRQEEAICAIDMQLAASAQRTLNLKQEVRKAEKTLERALYSLDSSFSINSVMNAKEVITGLEEQIAANDAQIAFLKELSAEISA